MKVYDRRRAIIETLCLRKHDIGKNFAFEFGVSVRTIYYDVNALTPYYPIQTQSGKGGGVYVEKDFRIDRKFLTDEQSELYIFTFLYIRYIYSGYDFFCN